MSLPGFPSQTRLRVWVKGLPRDGEAAKPLVAEAPATVGQGPPQAARPPVAEAAPSVVATGMLLWKSGRDWNLHYAMECATSRVDDHVSGLSLFTSPPPPELGVMACHGCTRTDVRRMADGRFGLSNEWPQWHVYHMQLLATSNLLGGAPWADRADTTSQPCLVPGLQLIQLPGGSALAHAKSDNVRLPSDPPQVLPTEAFVPPKIELLTGPRPTQLHGTCRCSISFIEEGKKRGARVVEFRPGDRHCGPNFTGPDWQNHGSPALPESRPEDLPLRNTPFARWTGWPSKAQRDYLNVSVRFQLVDPSWARLYIELNAPKV